MVSVVIPNYNSGKYLREAILSVLEQNVDLEVIVIDDASKDKSIDMIRDLMDAHPEIHLLKNDKNLGIASARNQGVLASRGEYVAFLDADDLWEKDKLEKQLAVMKKKKAVFCSTARRMVDENNEDLGNIIETPEKITLDMLEETNYINCSAVLARKDLLLQYPMEHDDAHEDYLTWLRILKDYKFVIAINEPLLRYRVSKKAKTRNKMKSAIMTYKTYRYAGYSMKDAVNNMLHYTYYGVKKHKGLKH